MNPFVLYTSSPLTLCYFIWFVIQKCMRSIARALPYSYFDSIFHSLGIHNSIEFKRMNLTMKNKWKMASIKCSFEWNCLLRYVSSSLKREFDPLCNLLNPRQICITLQTIYQTQHRNHLCPAGFSVIWCVCVCLCVILDDCPCAQLHVKWFECVLENSTSWNRIKTEFYYNPLENWQWMCQ